MRTLDRSAPMFNSGRAADIKRYPDSQGCITSRLGSGVLQEHTVRLLSFLSKAASGCCQRIERFRIMVASFISKANPEEGWKFTVSPSRLKATKTRTPEEDGTPVSFPPHLKQGCQQNTPKPSDLLFLPRSRSRRLPRRRFWQRSWSSWCRTLRTFDPMEIRNSIAVAAALREAARRGHRSAITGDGADELLGG